MQWIFNTLVPIGIISLFDTDATTEEWQWLHAHFAIAEAD
jgi:hypothetical protein